MAKTTTAVFTQNINNDGVTFVNADGTTPKTVFTAGADDSILVSLIAVTDDSSAVIVDIILNDGVTGFNIGAITVPTLSGTDGTAPAIDLINTTDIPVLETNSNGKAIIKLPSGWTVDVAPQADVTVAKTLFITAIGEDY